MDLLVFSHLRWNFVFQRPQHLMTRFAKQARVFFWEEPIFDSDSARLEIRQPLARLFSIVPHLPASITEDQMWRMQEMLLADLLDEHRIGNFVEWYYNPLAINFTRKLAPDVVVYDCMDELTGFRGAPPGLTNAEAELFTRADLVFTGGESLYRAKRRQHPRVHCFPSSIDKEFFGTARTWDKDPADQESIAHPRLGYCGVIDERMDAELLQGVADRRPDWHFIMLGPVVKIADSELPKGANVHYLGAKQYPELPRYMAGWDVGLLPFARNEATRFISPTKTPEYLAAGLSVVSTSIADVVRPYAVKNLVHVADTPEEFALAVEEAISNRHSERRRRKVDSFLRDISWDLTWRNMWKLIESQQKTPISPVREDRTVSLPISASLAPTD